MKTTTDLPGNFWEKQNPATEMLNGAIGGDNIELRTEFWRAVKEDLACFTDNDTLERLFQNLAGIKNDADFVKFAEIVIKYMTRVRGSLDGKVLQHTTDPLGPLTLIPGTQNSEAPSVGTSGLAGVLAAKKALTPQAQLAAIETLSALLGLIKIKHETIMNADLSRVQRLDKLESDDAIFRLDDTIGVPSKEIPKTTKKPTENTANTVDWHGAKFSTQGHAPKIIALEKTKAPGEPISNAELVKLGITSPRDTLKLIEDKFPAGKCPIKRDGKGNFCFVNLAEGKGDNSCILTEAIIDTLPELTDLHKKVLKYFLGHEGQLLETSAIGKACNIESKNLIQFDALFASLINQEIKKFDYSLIKENGKYKLEKEQKKN